MNVRLRESENKAKFAERLFDPEEPQVIGIDSGEFFGSVLQGKGKDIDFGTFDIFREIGIGTLNGHARFFPRDDSGRVLQPVKNTVVDLLHDIVHGNRSAGILKTTAAMITGRRGKQGPIRSQNIEAQQSQSLDQRNQSMKNLLVQGFSNTNAEVGKGGLGWNPISPKPRQTAVVTSTLVIPKDKPEVLDRSDPFQITKQVEQEKRNGIIARATENRICIGSNRADEGKIDNGSYQLTDAATNGSVVVNVYEFLAKFVMRKPTILFLGEGFAVTTKG